MELGVLALLTVTFLLLFPKRSPVADVGMATFALVCLGLSAGYTKKVIWAASPPPVAENRLKRCLVVTCWVTLPTALVLLAVGGVLACRSGGWPAFANRVLTWRLLAAFGCYALWAFMQQTLFQFYLLGRLLALFPNHQPVVPIAITGVGFALVHLPDVWTALATIPAGIIWTIIYYRYRLLWPLALSHAALGSAFYYGLFGQDLATEWRSFLP